jgi:hypothetical protein
MSDTYLTDASLKEQGIVMKLETAKPILDQIAKQIKEIWEHHTETSLLSGGEQNDMILLQNLYVAICTDVTICTEFIGRTYFYNIQRNVPKSNA